MGDNKHEEGRRRLERELQLEKLRRQEQEKLRQRLYAEQQKKKK